MSGSGLGRKFHFIREIASGGFGSVYLAKVIHGDGFARLAAIKLLHPKWSENEEIASRMRDEARLLGWLRHKNIVEVLDLTKIGGRVAVIMEYLEAVDVKVLINASEEPIPVRACLDVCAAVASALDAAYNRPPYAGEKPLRVIHRDIKPSNVMVDTGGGIKVLDFGVARADFAEREAHTQEMSFGSVDYMPPERLFFEPDTPKSDVYSLGTMLYELLAREKFGKAKLRAEQMTEYFDERWDALARSRALPSGEVGLELHGLLCEMLAFDGEDRPSAADCVTRMRALGRKVGDEDVAEWAETIVPRLVQQAQARDHRSPDSLVDQTISEDSRGFAREESETSEIHSKLRVDATLPPPAEDDDDLDHSGKLSDDQWHKLKQATLADLIDPEPPPAQRRPSQAPPEPAQARRSATAPPSAAPAAKAAPAPTPVVRTPTIESEPAPRRGGGGLLVVGLIGGFSVLILGVVALLIAVGGASLYGGSTVAAGTVEEAARAPAVAAPSVTNAPATEAKAGSPASSGGAASEAPEASAGAKAAAPAEAEEPAKAEEPAATFASAVATTKKITVRCTNGEGEGVKDATVAGKDIGDCTVTAVDQDRSRLTAVVKQVKSKAYVCFENGEKDCR